MKRVNLVISIWIGVALSGCGDSSPYSTVSQPLAPDRPKPEAAKAESVKFGIPSMIEMTEGMPTQFNVVAEVPGGNAVITLQGEPAGMTYDPSVSQVSWIPPNGSGIDPHNPTVLKRTYTVGVTLTSPSQPSLNIQQNIIIVVYHPG